MKKKKEKKSHLKDNTQCDIKKKIWHIYHTRIRNNSGTYSVNIENGTSSVKSGNRINTKMKLLHRDRLEFGIDVYYIEFDPIPICIDPHETSDVNSRMDVIDRRRSERPTIAKRTQNTRNFVCTGTISIDVLYSYIYTYVERTVIYICLGM